MIEVKLNPFSCCLGVSYGEWKAQNICFSSKVPGLLTVSVEIQLDCWYGRMPHFSDFIKFFHFLFFRDSIYMYVVYFYSIKHIIHTYFVILILSQYAIFCIILLDLSLSMLSLMLNLSFITFYLRVIFYIPRCTFLFFIYINFFILIGSEYFLIWNLERERQTDMHTDIHTHTHSLSSAGSLPKCQAGLKLGIGSSGGLQGLKYLNHHLLPPTVLIIKKLELRTETDLESRNSSMGCGYPK